MSHRPPARQHADVIGALFQETGFLVLRRCRRMLYDPEEAMDVTQWTYLRAIEVGFEFRTRPEALSWLYRTATQRCLTLIRDAGTRRRIREQHAGELVSEPAPSPEGRAADRDLLLRALSAVDDETAEVALLTHFQDLSSERAAAITGTSLRTVARARARFEAEVRRLGGET